MSGDAEWPKVADAVIEASQNTMETERPAGGTTHKRVKRALKGGRWPFIARSAVTGGVCPLSELIPEQWTPELCWLQAWLGAMLPYRQAATVLRGCGSEPKATGGSVRKRGVRGPHPLASTPRPSISAHR